MSFKKLRNLLKLKCLNYRLEFKLGFYGLIFYFYLIFLAIMFNTNIFKKS